MTSPFSVRAVEDALHHGNALLKFISANDVNLTGAHQSGFYLPKSVWQMYSPNPPTNGVNAEHTVHILWQDGSTTESRIKWYGRRTRSEYRLTRFGRDFRWVSPDVVGDLLVLIPIDLENILAYVLDREDDIQNMRAALGLEEFKRWGVYEAGAPRFDTEEDCVERRFQEFADTLAVFPAGEVFSETTQSSLEACIRGFLDKSLDDVLLRCVEAEYRLFRIVERRLCQEDMTRLFRDIDDFIRVAQRILQRRKARAGRSLEYHLHYVLSSAGIPHEMWPRTIDGEPDIVIPHSAAYHDLNYPRGRVWIVGVKTTCKDRWRQVLNEGTLVPRKHILTIQKGISANQLKQMSDAQVTLVVPKPLHKAYPSERGIEIMTVDTFVRQVRGELAQS